MRPLLQHPGVGAFVRARGRRWLVEGHRELGDGLATLQLACVDDDAQGEATEVVWSAELNAAPLDDAGWDQVARTGTDDPAVFAAYVRTLRWGTATAADRDLFQAPFRAGIRLDAYQLLPLRKALRLPRVNLLIADDVGAGKTVEAALVLREMLLRRRVDYAVVAAPAGMTRQWQDELDAKFGLAFTIVDREHLASLRQERGFGANPWRAGSYFVVSHSLLTDEVYMAGLRETLGALRGKAMLVLDEAHHAAPASASRYAVDSQFTRAIRDLAARFEHRLFLSATPHNGHSNSFSSLLEILDPQRFTRGVPVRPGDLDPVMVRRLKTDLRYFGERFPERIVEPIVIAGLAAGLPDLALPHMLAAYGETLRRRAAALPPRQAGFARLAFVGLQQRLLSSPAAFARTLQAHLRGLDRRDATTAATAAAQFATGAHEPEDEADTEQQALLALQAEDDEAAEAAAIQAAPASDRDQVEAMLAVARAAAAGPDARVRWLAEWVRANLAPGGAWNDRRLVVFTEWEATRHWLQRRLSELLDGLAPDSRIAAFTGATPPDRREDLKRSFNADPGRDPLRILLCTDAAREGINLQARCSDLIHFDLPWNPARLEQRNGRIDRKLQPAATVHCRYFRYEQREEDIVLEVLVRKTELIRNQLGSVGQVLAARITDQLARGGIVKAAALAREISSAESGPLARTAQAELDDATDRRRARQARELDDLRRVLELSRKRVGVDPGELQAVVGVALTRAGAPMQADAASVNGTTLFRLDPALPAFAAAGWPEALDTLRTRRRGRSERLRDWRAAAPLRALSFQPAITAEGADAEGVLQLHLEHRLVRRLLSRFLSQGFQSGLARACVVVGPGAQPRVVLLGRLALYGPGAARLHEELIPVIAAWVEAGRGTVPLRPFGQAGESSTLDQLEAALQQPRRPPPNAVDRVRGGAAKDAADLEPELRRRAAARRVEVVQELADRGASEAAALLKLLQDQRDRVQRAEEAPEDVQFALFHDDEAEQRRRDRQHWRRKVAALDLNIEQDPARVAQAYAVRADRVEIVGLLYLWPGSN